jgi:hypothetical protein
MAIRRMIEVDEGQGRDAFIFYFTPFCQRCRVLWAPEEEL